MSATATLNGKIYFHEKYYIISSIKQSIEKCNQAASRTSIIASCDQNLSEKDSIRISLKRMKFYPKKMKFYPNILVHQKKMKFYPKKDEILYPKKDEILSEKR